MKICAVLLSIFSSTAQTKKTSAQQVFEALELPELAPIFPENLNKTALLPLLYEKSAGFEALVLAHADSDFYLLEENRKLLENFCRYQADFAYSDNHPAGITFEIVKRAALPVLEKLRLQNNFPLTRDLFYKLISLDFNTFELENLYSEFDLRAFRLSCFAREVQENFFLGQLKALIKAAHPEISPRALYKMPYAAFAQLILNNRKILRVPPKHYSILLTNRSEVGNLFMPAAKMLSPLGQTLDLAAYEKILAKIVAFSGAPVISLGNGAGFLFTTTHPRWEKIVELTLLMGVECILETSGVNFTPQTLTTLKKFKNSDKLRVIFQFPSLQQSTYEKFYQTQRPFHEILTLVEHFLLHFPENTYVETVKTMENYAELPEFYAHFKRFTKKILIAKYNPCRGKLRERRFKPMKPLKAIDCWHLKRNWLVDFNGEVWSCKQDLDKEVVLGNLITQSPEEIFEKGQAEYEKYLRGEKKKFCQLCDEYYTYTF